MENNDKITSAKILIIDDDVNMMDILSVILNNYGHTIVSFTEPVSAIEKLKSEKFDILIVNYLMTPVNGDRIVHLVREFDKEIYIILMSMHKDLTPSLETMQNLDIQAYFEKSSRFEQLILFIQSGINYINQVNNIRKMSTKLEKYLVDFAKILLNTVGAKDNYTEGHSIRVSEFSVLFGKYLKLSDKDIENLKTAGHFHDIGKIGIPDNVLLKNGTLDSDEYDLIKSHPIIGSNILSVSEIFSEITPIVLHHHERIDGKGYPDKLKQNNIPYLARILSVCDSFDAITSKRPYKQETSIEYAISELKKARNTQLDSKIVDEFLIFLEKESDDIKKIMSIK